MNIKKILIIVLFLIIIGPLIGYSVYKYLNGSKTTFDESTILSEKLQKDISTGIETGEEYKNVPKLIESISSEIKNTSIFESEREKLLKKIIYNRAVLSPGNQNATEIDKINSFNDILSDYNSIEILEKKDNINLIGLKARYISSFYDSLLDHPLNIFEKTNWVKTEEYKIFEQRYTDKTIASRLYVDLLFGSVDQYNDKLLSGQKINNISFLLTIFESKLELGDRDYLIKELTDTLANYANAKETDLSVFNSEKFVLPLFYEARGYATLSKYREISDPIVLSKFDAVYKKINEIALSKDDRVYQIELRAKMIHVVYVFERNNNIVNNDVIKLIREIENFENNYKGNSEMLNFVKFNIANIRPENSLLKIAEQDPQFKLYISKYRK